MNYSDNKGVNYDQDTYEMYDRMRSDLAFYERHGVALKIHGRRESSDKIADICCLRETGSYMGDYILDGTGHLKEIRFDRIAPQNKPYPKYKKKRA